MGQIEDFFGEIDSKWEPVSNPRVKLRVIGSGALMLQKDYVRGTKDSDIFEAFDLDAQDKMRLVALAGKGTEIHQRRHIYLDLVPNGIPFLPHPPCWRDVPRLASLASFEVLVLDVVDVVVSKLKRFNANDVDDIAAMVDGLHVQHPVFVSRFKSALTELAHTAHADLISNCVENFHVVERDMFVTEETQIELPTWV